MLNEALARVLGVVGVLALFAACSDDETKKPPPGSGGADAASGRGGSAGSGGRGGTGGSGASGGTGGASGSAGTGASDAAPDVLPDVSDSGSDVADAHDAGFTCALPEGGADSGGSWRDFEAGVCRPCPSYEMSCFQFLFFGQPLPQLDRVTGLATIHIEPGVAEIVSGTWSFDYQVQTGAGSVLGSAMATFQVNRNTLTANLRQAVSPQVGPFDSVHNSNIVLVDACGAALQPSTEGNSLDFYLETTDAGENVLTARCVID